MGQNSLLKGSLFLVWLALVGSVSTAIYRQDDFFAKEGRSMARLAQKSGSVLTRGEGLVRWRETIGGQDLYDGDHLATGRGSKATISFGGNRKLRLGGETQIQITGIMRASGDFALLIKLLKGSMMGSVSGTCKQCAPILVRAGQQSYSISSGKQVAVHKKVGKKATTFEPKGPWPVSKPPERPKLKKSFVEPKPKKKPLDDASGFVTRIGGAREGKTWWTWKPVGELRGQTLVFPLEQPRGRPKNGRLSSVVQVSGPNGRGRTSIERVSLSESRFRLPIRKVIDAASMRRRNGVAEYRFAIRGGAVVSGDEKRKQSFQNRWMEYRIRSVGEPGPGPVTVGLDRVKTKAADGPWLQPKKLLNVSEAPVVVGLANGNDYSRLLPFIRGAAAVGLGSRGIWNSKGTFVVRDEQVVAQIGGDRLNKALVRKLTGVLDGDFVFRGARSALHDSRGQSDHDLTKWITTLLGEGKVLYVLKRNKLYPVSRDFIKTNREVAQFVDSNAKAIFLDDVEIVHAR